MAAGRDGRDVARGPQNSSGKDHVVTKGCWFPRKGGGFHKNYAHINYEPPLNLDVNVAWQISVSFLYPSITFILGVVPRKVDDDDVRTG